MVSGCVTVTPHWGQGVRDPAAVSAVLERHLEVCRAVKVLSTSFILSAFHMGNSTFCLVIVLKTRMHLENI